MFRHLTTRSALVALLMGACGLVPLVTASATAASAGTITVRGNLRSPSGAITGGTVTLIRHATSNRIGSASVNRSGSFVAHINRSRVLAGSAHNHGGYLNIDFYIKRGSHLYARGVRLRYNQSTVRLGSVALRSVSFKQRPANARPVLLPSSLDGAQTFTATVMNIQHAPDEWTSYSYDSGGNTSITVGYGADVKTFHASGSMEVSSDSRASASGEFGKGKHNNAGLLLRLPMQVVTQVEHIPGPVNPYGAVQAYYDTYTSSATWDGTVQEVATKHLGCDSPGVTNRFNFDARFHTLNFEKTSGQALTVVGSLGVSGMSAEIATGWSKSVQQVYHFNIPRVKGYYYCLGGFGKSWVASDRVAISTTPKSSGGTSCRKLASPEPSSTKPPC